MGRLAGVVASNRRMALAMVLSLGLHFAGLFELRLPFGRVAPSKPLMVTLEGVESLLPTGEEGASLKEPSLDTTLPAEGGEEFGPSEETLFPLPPPPIPSPSPFPWDESESSLPSPMPDITEGEGPPSQEGREAAPAEEAPEIGPPLAEFEATIRPGAIEPLRLVKVEGEGAQEVEPPELLLALMPTYPEEAVEKGLQGEVVVDILVGKDGKPLSAKVSGEERLRPLVKPILEAIRNWRFKPAKRGGEPIKAAVKVRLKFVLEAKAPPSPVVAISPPREGERPKVEGKEIEVAAEYVGLISPSIILPLAEARPRESSVEEPKLTPPKPLFPLMPPYPKDAIEAGEEGEVVVYILVGEDGLPKRTAVEATGVPVSLMRAALEAISTWRFEPAREGEKAVEAWVKIRLRFKKEVEEGGEEGKERDSTEPEATQGAKEPASEGGMGPWSPGAVLGAGGEAGA